MCQLIEWNRQTNSHVEEETSEVWKDGMGEWVEREMHGEVESQSDRLMGTLMVPWPLFSKDGHINIYPILHAQCDVDMAPQTDEVDVLPSEWRTPLKLSQSIQCGEVMLPDFGG